MTIYPPPSQRIPQAIFWGILILFLATMTLGMQISGLATTNADRLAYLQEGTQLIRHQAVLNGTASSPWQYRPLAEWVTEVVLVTFRSLNLPSGNALGFVGVRWLQNLAVFALLVIYFQRLRLVRTAVLIGLAAFAWAVTHSGYGSDLSANTYFDVIFYLLGALWITARRYAWLVPLMIAAGLNRETSGLIPILALVWAWRTEPSDSRNRALGWSAVALAVYGLITVGVRVAYGSRSPDVPLPGIEAFRYNLTNIRGWIILAATVNILPVLGWINRKIWPPFVTVAVIVILPLWVAIHLFTSIIAETRLFLVPLAIALIPAAVAGIREATHHDRS